MLGAGGVEGEIVTKPGSRALRGRRNPVCRSRQQGLGAARVEAASRQQLYIVGT